jgi:hypothetical protein
MFASFTYTKDVSTLTGEVGFALQATDQLGAVTTERIVVYRDNAPPVLSISEPTLFAAPEVNTVTQLPLVLNGTVDDETLSGISINNNRLGLAPGLEANSYTYSVALNLSPQQEQILNIEAWDKAGNRTKKTFIVNADIAAAVEVIAPKNNQEYQVTGQSTLVEIVARILGNYTGFTALAFVDNKDPVPLTLEAQAVTGAVAVDATDGQHTIKLKIHDDQNVLVSSQLVKVNIVNIDNIPLALERSEPKNGDTGIEPNDFITFYFNKPIDPSKLQMELLQTVHGETYDLGGNFGVTPLLAGNTAKIVEVHQDQKKLKGEWSFLPSNRIAAYYTDKDFAYNADLLAKVSYDGQLLQTMQFKVRRLPTFLQGFAADSLLQPISGLTVELPDIGRRAITDANGSYEFGFGKSAQRSLPPGRHRIIFNPNRQNPKYGEVATLVDVVAGRLTNAGLTAIPIISNEIPFHRISSGQTNVILAKGELVVDLTNTQLEFRDGNNFGDVYVQFLPRSGISYSSQPAATPQWMFATQPPGIKVSGDLQVTMKMPAIKGRTDYIPADGTLALMIGFDEGQNQLVPIGVGKIQDNQVVSVTKLLMSRLDYIGYTLKDTESQQIMQRFVNGSISFENMVIELNAIAGELLQ